MCMSDILCVTNRTLCRESFIRRLDRIAAFRPAGILLREKDLTPQAYRELAMQVLPVCRRHKVPCILHNFVDVAMQLRSEAIHVPLPILREMSQEQKSAFCVIGTSCHSAQEAVEAQLLGCTYITAGHIFDTDCKKGLPGRGLPFLEEVCTLVTIPVWAIGGIDAENVAGVREAGAAGVCLMSSLMNSDHVEELMHSIMAG